MKISVFAVASACVALAACTKMIDKPPTGSSPTSGCPECNGALADGAASLRDGGTSHDGGDAAEADGGTKLDGSVGNTDGGNAHFLSDAAAPLPQLEDASAFDAIWVPRLRAVYRPLFSTPSCNVVPPYGETYIATFPAGVGPNGTFPACVSVPFADCYTPERSPFDGITDQEVLPGGVFELSAFDGDGIATGAMDTTEGLVRLTVKACP